MDSLFQINYPVELIGFENHEIMTTPNLLVCLLAAFVSSFLTLLFVGAHL
jgi:hypothetical protein